VRGFGCAGMLNVRAVDGISRLKTGAPAPILIAASGGADYPAGVGEQPRTVMRLNVVCLKLVRWTAWPLLLTVLSFLFTGYSTSGRYGLGRLMDEQTALTWHKLLHVPLIALLLAHSLPAMYLAFQRWGWLALFKPREKREKEGD